MVDQTLPVDLEVADEAPFVRMLVDFGEELRMAGLPLGSGIC